MIELVDVEKYYPVGNGRFYVLRKINLRVQEGDPHF